MPSDRAFISQPLYNDTPRNNMYSIAAVENCQTRRGNEPVLPNQGELLYAPLRFHLPPGSSEYFPSLLQRP
ncbi:CFA/I fimbrial chaperone [Klebsiella oxytoca]|nr:CFA/I fimbrial chaperone [Klebsiella oxytoca]